MTETLTRPPNLTSSQAISQHEVIVRQYELIVDLRDALREIEKRDRLYVCPSNALDPSRIIEHQPGCNVLYMGEHAVRARAARAKADNYLK
jgi:hypothetical protein